MQVKDEFAATQIFLEISISGAETGDVPSVETIPDLYVFCCVFLVQLFLRDVSLQLTDAQNGDQTIKEVSVELVSNWDSLSLRQKSLTRSSHHRGGVWTFRGQRTPQRPQALHHVTSALPKGQTQLAHMCGGRQHPGMLLNSNWSLFESPLLMTINISIKSNEARRFLVCLLLTMRGFFLRHFEGIIIYLQLQPLFLSAGK